MRRLRRPLLSLAALIAWAAGPARGDFSLFVATGDNTITQIDSTGGASVFASTNIFAPQGVVADDAGNIYVANPIDNTIEAFSPASVDLGPVAFTGLNGPFPLAFHGGSLFAGNTGDGTIEQFTTSGVDLGPFTTTNLITPGGLAFDASGRLYASDATSNVIEVFSPTGTTSAPSPRPDSPARRRSPSTRPGGSTRPISSPTRSRSSRPTAPTSACSPPPV